MNASLTWKRPATAACALLAIVLVLLVAAPAASAATPDPVPVGDGRTVAEFGDLLVVHRGETVDAAVNFGGDIVIGGTVRQTVVAIGGDVRLKPTAVVGTDTAADESSVVVVNGTLVREPGARVVGGVETVHIAEFWKDVDPEVWAGIVRPLMFWTTVGGWLVTTAMFVILALVAAAIMPNQVRAAQRQLDKAPWASLGWGALTALVLVPLAFVVLLITIVGIVLIPPAAIFVVMAGMFAVWVVAAWVVQHAVQGRVSERNELLLSMAVGAVAVSIVVMVPVVGWLIVMVTSWFGIGAIAMAVAEHRRARKALATAPVGAQPSAALRAPTTAQEAPTMPPAADEEESDDARA